MNFSFQKRVIGSTYFKIICCPSIKSESLGFEIFPGHVPLAQIELPLLSSRVDERGSGRAVGEGDSVERLSVDELGGGGVQFEGVDEAKFSPVVQSHPLFVLHVNYGGDSLVFLTSFSQLLSLLSVQLCQLLDVLVLANDDP